MVPSLKLKICKIKKIIYSIERLLVLMLAKMRATSSTSQLSNIELKIFYSLTHIIKNTRNFSNIVPTCGSPNLVYNKPLKWILWSFLCTKKAVIAKERSFKLQSKNHTIYPADKNATHKTLRTIYVELTKKCEEILKNGCNWTLKQIQFVEIHLNKLNPLKGGGSTYLDLPLWIKIRKACINVRSKGNCYFKYLILCGISITSWPPFRKKFKLLTFTK